MTEKPLVSHSASAPSVSGASAGLPAGCDGQDRGSLDAEAVLGFVRWWFENDSGIQKALHERRAWHEPPGTLELVAAALGSR